MDKGNQINTVHQNTFLMNKQFKSKFQINEYMYNLGVKMDILKMIQELEDINKKLNKYDCSKNNLRQWNISS